jgi:hypothetical protein
LYIDSWGVQYIPYIRLCVGSYIGLMDNFNRLT